MPPLDVEAFLASKDHTVPRAHDDDPTDEVIDSDTPPPGWLMQADGTYAPPGWVKRGELWTKGAP